MAAGILDSFMRGYNFGDSVQQRQVDRKFQEEVRGRQRLEWQRNDQAIAVDELQREWQAKLGTQTMDEAEADPANEAWITDLTQRTADVLGVTKRLKGNAKITKVVPTGDGKVTALMDLTDEQGNVVASGVPPTVNQTSEPDDPIVSWDHNDIFAALRAKSKEFHAAMQASETSAQASQAMTDYLSEQGATYQAPSTQYEAQSTQNQGLRSAINGQPRTGMANEKFALSTVGSETVPASPYATGAQQTPIDGMDPAEQAKLNAYLDASVEKGRAAPATTQSTPPPPPAKTLADAQKEKDAKPDLVTRGVNAVLDGLKRGAGEESRHKAVVDAALDINNARGDQVRRNPKKFQEHYTKVRDQYTPAQQAQLDQLFGHVEETPTSGRIQRSAKNEVPGTKSSAPVKSDPQVDQLTDAKAKQVAASVRPPQNEKQLEGMQKQIENIRSSGQVTAKQKRALGQLFRLNKITAEQYERAMTTGRLNKRELDQIKTDSRIYVWDKETGEVVSSVENLPQGMTVADANAAVATAQKKQIDLANAQNTFIDNAYGFMAEDYKGKRNPEAWGEVKSKMLVAADTLGFDPYQQEAVPVIRNAKKLQDAYTRNNGPAWWNLWLKDEPQFGSYTPGIIAQQTGLDMDQTLGKYYAPVRAALGDQADGIQSKVALIVAGAEQALIANGVAQGDEAYKMALEDTLRHIKENGLSVVNDPAAMVRRATKNLTRQ